MFSFYGGNLEYIILTLKPADDETAQQEKTAFCKKNWQYLIAMNVRKANYICTGENELPDVENTQQDVYDNQLAKFVNTEECKVAILNAFPIFLYEYFGRKVLMSN